MIFYLIGIAGVLVLAYLISRQFRGGCSSCPYKGSCKGSCSKIEDRKKAL